MNRRRFLTWATALAATAAADPERLLWTPGAKRLFIPPVTGWSGVDWSVDPDWTCEIEVGPTYESGRAITMRPGTELREVFRSTLPIDGVFAYGRQVLVKAGPHLWELHHIENPALLKVVNFSVVETHG